MKSSSNSIHDAAPEKSSMFVELFSLTKVMPAIYAYFIMMVTLYMAESLNGIIANENGGEDFLSDKNWEVFTKLANNYGNLVMGRKTYESVSTWGAAYSLDKLKGVKKVIVSKSGSVSGEEYFAASSPEQAIEILIQQGFDRLLLAGGATLNTAFLEKNLIDEIILNIEPVLVGKGKPLFASAYFNKRLRLKNIETLAEGIVQLRYDVEK